MIVNVYMSELCLEYSDLLSYKLYGLCIVTLDADLMVVKADQELL